MHKPQTTGAGWCMILVGEGSMYLSEPSRMSPWQGRWVDHLVLGEEKAGRNGFSRILAPPAAK